MTPSNYTTYFSLHTSVVSRFMPLSKETLTGSRDVLSDLFICCTLWIHVGQDTCDASHVPCPSRCCLLVAAGCWVLLAGGRIAGWLLGAAKVVKRVLGLSWAIGSFVKRCRDLTIWIEFWPSHICIHICIHIYIYICFFIVIYSMFYICIYNNYIYIYTFNT